LTFESGSKLEEIANRAFWGCEQLKSIRIPPSLKLTLHLQWHEGSSLKNVIFESGASLLAAIQANRVDLQGRFVICASDLDGVTIFPG
jgi:hypothetical protein